MARSNWMAGAALVLLVLLVALTFDPLGFFEAGHQAPPPAGDEGLEPLPGAGLKGRGKAPLPDQDPRTWEGEPVGLLVLELGGATLKGTVTGSGEPLRFARVRPVLPPPNHTAAVRTRKDGGFEIRGLPEGQHELRAAAAGYLGRTVLAPPVANEQVVTVEPIDLRPRPSLSDALAVKVTDLFGRPVQGAHVLATTMPWDLHVAIGPELAGIQGVVHAKGTTDEQGRVSLGPLPPDDYNVMARAEGYVNGGVNNVVLNAGRTRHVLVRLAEGVAIRGRVVDEAGEGVEGAVVMGFAQPSFWSSLVAYSTADGSYVLDGLRRGAYMVFAYEEQQGTVMTTGKAPSSGVTLKLEGTGVVEGQALWADGKPVEAGQVRPYQTGPFQYVYSQVHPLSPEGRWRVHLPRGNWHFRVQADNGQMADDTVAKVDVGQTSKVTVTMPRTGVLRGVVMDEAGNHVEGAEIFVMKGGFPASPSREQYDRSDAEGQFEVRGLPFEPVKLHVVHAAYADTKIDANPSAAGAAKEVSVRLSRGARVVGRVTDAEGRGVAAEQVNLVVDWFNARTTYTDEEGRYAFSAVSPGTYTLTTGPYEQGARGLRKGGVRVGEGGEVVVDFQNPAAAGRVTGEVRQGGAPVAGAEVSLQDARGAEYAVATRTDEAGRFAAEGLQYGRVRIVVRTADGLTGLARTQVAEGAAPTHVVLEIGAASLRARAVDEEGKPISGCWASVELAGDAEDGWGRVKRNGNTNSEGIFESKGLEAGTYVLRVNRVEYAQYLSAPFTLKEGEEKNLGDIRMTRGALLSGQVRDDAGAPIEKATVSLEDAQGRPVFLFSMSTTGSDGRYSMYGVEPGRYTVRFEAGGHAPGAQPVEVTAAGATADATLTRGGRVDIQVEDDGGHPLAGVRIRLFDDRGRQVTKTISLANFDTGRRTTGADGRTQLADLAAGHYTVRGELTGYVPVGAEPRVYVTPGGAVSARLVLEPSP